MAAEDQKMQELNDAVTRLQKENRFAQARQELERALETISKESDDYVWVQQQRALCTYKDTQLRPDAKFAAALGILKQIGLCKPGMKNPETLGLGGAIYKRMWEHEGKEEHLRASLALYRAGWESGKDAPQAPERKSAEGPADQVAEKEYEKEEACRREYCGVNAAYILDLLAYLAERTARRTGIASSEAEDFRKQARDLRDAMLDSHDLLESVHPEVNRDYWSVATIAEIHFGLGNYGKAQDLLAKVHELEPEEWKFQTTVVQLLNLARWQNIIDGTALGAAFVDVKPKAKECRDALRALLGDKVDAALGRFRGKVGLALSGGGFRAAFFHLGVLARLAEIDALRHVEVISTVSGGSIVGAHYYLELKQLLLKSDGNIHAQDYISLVSQIQERFLASVQRNLRMRMLDSFWSNMRMLVIGDYTRSKRIGRLYETEIYSKVADGGASRVRTMSSLKVCPFGYAAPDAFMPKQQNWLRKAKVPELVINTTSLNSGHNFQFTASWMGEPPGLTGAEVDMNIRHRRLYYKEAPTELQDFPLGYAVAASSSVPGIFDPLVIDGLYPGRSIRLVDGGVHDNQGTTGLLDEECDFIICSDASGQMHDEVTPPIDLLSVPLRANDIMMDRVRECEFDHLESMARSGRLKGLFFVHLKKDLAQEDIGWVGATEKQPAPQCNQTPYGVDRDIQRRLAEIRTDLDAFSEVEAYALMLSGYQMAEEHARSLNMTFLEMGGSGTWGGFDVDAPRGDWPFLQLSPIAAKPADSSDLRRVDLEKQLAVGKGCLFKAWQLNPWLRGGAWFLLVSVVSVAVGLLWWVWQSKQTLSVFWIVISIILALISFLFPSWAVIINPKGFCRKKALNIGLALAGWMVAKFHLAVLDPIFLRRGRLNRLLRLPSK